MISFGEMALLRPWWLLALPLLLALALWARRQSLGLAGWEAAIDPPLLAALERLGHVRRRRSSWWPPLPLVIGLLLALALAGPALRAEAPAFRNLNGIVIVFDLSPSVARGGGLGDAQAAAALVLERAAGRPVALILYAGQAYLASALTSDASTPESLIGVLDVDTMPDGGSRPDRALDLAADVLKEAKLTRSDVVLISDGGGLGPATDAAAERLQAVGGRLFTVFVAPSKPQAGLPMPDAAGLQRLASLGGGRAELASEPTAIAAAVAASDADIVAAGLVPLYFTDLGPLLALLALLPAFLLFRRSA